MEHLEKQFTEKELRRFVEFSEMKIMKQGDVDLLPNGGYLFEGEVMCDGSKYSQEQFISQQKPIKALNEVILMKFKKAGGIGFKSEERISIFNAK